MHMSGKHMVCFGTSIIIRRRSTFSRKHCQFSGSILENSTKMVRTHSCGRKIASNNIIEKESFCLNIFWSILVGWTCSFIGTTYWKSGDDRESLKYLLEARLIFCKAGKGNLIGVDQTICCILLKAGLDENEIDNYQTAVESTIKHEIQGDYYKKMGDLTEAKEEYRRARAVSKSLMDIFVLDA